MKKPSELDLDAEVMRRVLSLDVKATRKCLDTLAKKGDYHTFLTVTLQLHMNNQKDLCSGCSLCCEFNVGVRLSSFDVKRISNFLGVTEKNFLHEHTFYNENFGAFCLKVTPCVFLLGKRCQIYHVRPTMCIGYPFILLNVNAVKNNEIVFPSFCQSAKESYEIQKRVYEQIKQQYGDKALERYISYVKTLLSPQQTSLEI
jgi:Fe-S-cluster containining protein